MKLVNFFRHEDVFDAGVFALDFISLGIDESDAVPIDDFDDAAGLVLGLPEDAFIAGLAEAGVECRRDEVLG